MSDTVIQDEKGRTIVIINDKGETAFARFPDLEETTKDYMIELCKGISEEDPEKLRDFLNYKSEEDEFCV